MTRNNFKIQGGGFRIVLTVFFTTIFWVIFVFAIIETASTETSSTVIIFRLAFGIIICSSLSVIAYIFWKYNYIIIAEEKLVISTWEWSRGERLHKPKKKSIRLDDIEGVSVKKRVNKYSVQCVKLIIKNRKHYYMDTTLFSKVDFWGFLKELEKMGINVEIKEV